MARPLQEEARTCNALSWLILWSLSTSFKKSWEREGCIAFVRFVDDMFFCVAMMQQ
jgi:hypothetical protein